MAQGFEAGNVTKPLFPHEKLHEVGVRTMEEFIAKSNGDMRKFLSGDEKLIQETPKKSGNKSLELDRQQSMYAEKSAFDKMAASDPAFQKTQLVNLRKIQLGMIKADVVRILGQVKGEDKTESVLIYMMYGFGDLLYVSGKHVMPQIPVILRFDEKLELSAVVTTLIENTTVYGKVPPYPPSKASDTGKTSPVVIRPTPATAQPAVISNPPPTKLVNLTPQESLKIAIFKKELGASGSDMTRQMSLFRAVPKGNAFLFRELPAESLYYKAGIRMDDLVLAVNGESANSIQILMKGLNILVSKTNCNFLVERQQQIVQLNVTFY